MLKLTAPYEQYYNVYVHWHILYFLDYMKILWHTYECRNSYILVFYFTSYTET